MKLAIVIGQVVCTAKHPGLEHDRLLLVQMANREGKPEGELNVATDTLGAGDGEWVLVVSGSSARRARDLHEAPVDMSVVGIVDETVINGRIFYRKGNE